MSCWRGVACRVAESGSFLVPFAAPRFKECKESKRGMTFERFKLLVKKVSKKLHG